MKQERNTFAFNVEKRVIPDDYDYYTYYHMNKKGVDRRTETIIKYLKEAL